MVKILTNVEGGSEDSICSIQTIDSTYKEMGTEKLSGGRILKAGTEKSSEENILQIHREKQRILTEAITEKDQRLESLEKEMNDHTIQQKEGIYWLRLQLNTSRQEKNAAEERIAELQDELRRLNSDKPRRNISMDFTISDSIGNGDEKDNLINRLESRVRKYETSFGVMENQISMIEASSGEVVKTLKEEIANLMEDRTRTELHLLNQLSELDNENRRRQLEYTLELHNKDETIEALRNLDSHSKSVKGLQVSSVSTVIYNGSSSTENTNNSIFECEIWSGNQANDLPTNESRPDSSLILRLGEEKAELQRKLEESNRELDDLRSGLNVMDSTGLVNKKLENSRSGLNVNNNPEFVQQLSEERQAINTSIERVKSVLVSTNAAVSNLKGSIEKLKTDDNSDAGGEKQRMLSVLEPASLIHEEVKLSILLIELKVRNEFECLKKNRLMNDAHHQATPDHEELVNDIKLIKNDALIELRKAEVEFSRHVKDLERTTMLEKKKLDDFLQNNSQKRVRKHGSKSSKASKTPVVNKFVSKSSKTSQTTVLEELLSTCQTDRASRDGLPSTGNGLMISRDVLHSLEKELHQFAERLLAKNQKIMLLKEEVDIHKIRESNLRKDLRALKNSNVVMNRSSTKISKDTSSKSYNKAVHDINETNEAVNKNSMFPQNIPREIRTRMKVGPITPIGVSPKSCMSGTKFKGESGRRRKGMSDDSQEGGTNPIASVHPLTPGRRHDSIGFVPSPPLSGKKKGSKVTSETSPTKGATRRLQPTSREIKKLVFLPPCFFSDFQ